MVTNFKLIETMNLVNLVNVRICISDLAYLKFLVGDIYYYKFVLLNSDGIVRNLSALFDHNDF